MQPPHVQVRDLQVTASSPDDREITIVSNISFEIARGEVLALIGESGSGKTTVALSLLGYARGSCELSGGSIKLGDTELMELDQQTLESLRGKRVSYVAQSAAAAFNPSKTIMDQVTEVAAIHNLMCRTDAEAKAIEIFRSLALPNPETLGQRYPHQVSGGQLQRLMAAMALLTDPELVIFDEPTTALDVTTQIDVLKAFKDVVRQRDITAIYVSHDLAVVAQMADQILVLKNGRIQEQGQTEQVLTQPSDQYTRQLMSAARHSPSYGMEKTNQEAPLISVNNLVAGYGNINASGQPKIPILSQIDFQLQRGSTLGVIGESGSGKSTLARVIAGLLPAASGNINFQGKTLPSNLKQRDKDQLRRIQLVFQNADTALNPSHTVGQILGRPLTIYHQLKGKANQQRVAELLELVRLPTDLAQRACNDLSGGQKQRINLARALAAEPDLILCDEITSALDTVVGAAILDLLNELQQKLKLSIIFISHDISTVRSICDDVLVLYSGQRVEYGPRASFAKAPFHPYTRLLIESVPELKTGWLEDISRETDLPVIDAISNASGLCRFIDRCSVRLNGHCNQTSPPLLTLDQGNQVLCHHKKLFKTDIPPNDAAGEQR